MTIVTAAQAHVLAANANDSAVLREYHALAELIGVPAEAAIASIEYQPPRGPRAARLAVTTYVLDEAGERSYVHEDGTPYDPTRLKPWRVATETTTEILKFPLPTWWDQAVRVAAPLPVASE